MATTIYVEIPQSDAIARGSAQWGKQPLDLEAVLALLIPEERNQLFVAGDQLRIKASEYNNSPVQPPSVHPDDVVAWLRSFWAAVEAQLVQLRADLDVALDLAEADATARPQVKYRELENWTSSLSDTQRARWEVIHEAREAEAARARAATLAEVAAAPIRSLMRRHRGYWEPYSPHGDWALKERLGEINAACTLRDREAAAKAEALRLEHRETQRRLLAEHGDQSQRERFSAGVLPERELREVARAVLFAPLADFASRPRYTADDLEHEDDCCTEGVSVDWAPVETPELTAAQFARLQEIRAAVQRVKGAECRLRLHTVECDGCEAEEGFVSARVSLDWAGLMFARDLELD